MATVVFDDFPQGVHPNSTSGRLALTPTLPSEIQHHIIDIIFGPDLHAGPLERQKFIETLKSCALVCHSWHRRIVRHQFRQARLDIGTQHVSFRLHSPPPMLLGRFIDLMEADPFLLRSIQIAIITSHDSDEDDFSLSDAHLESIDAMVARFCHALQPCVEEVRLTLSGDHEKSFPHRLGVLHTLAELCSGPRLQSLTLSSSVPIPCILAAQHLKTLTFISCAVYLDHSKESPMLEGDMLSDGQTLSVSSPEEVALHPGQTRSGAVSERRRLEQFTFETFQLSLDEAIFAYEQLWVISQRSASFASSLAGIRKATINMPSTPFPTGLSKLLFSETLQELSIASEPQENYLSENGTECFASIHWTSLTSLTTLKIELRLGLRKEIWTVLRYVEVESWVTKPPSDFLLLCSDLPSLNSLALQVDFSDKLVFINRGAISGAVEHVFKDSCDGCFVLPRFRALRQLSLGMEIVVRRDGGLFRELEGGAFDEMLRLSLPSLFGLEGRASNGLDVSISCGLDLHDSPEEYGEEDDGDEEDDDGDHDHDGGGDGEEDEDDDEGSMHGLESDS